MLGCFPLEVSFSTFLSWELELQEFRLAITNIATILEKVFFMTRIVKEF
jgi:hypothetical protein